LNPEIRNRLQDQFVEWPLQRFEIRMLAEPAAHLTDQLDQILTRLSLLEAK
jgi:hypothetical protein